ncbi:serine hydrolase domain-containing protein [Aquimarina algiphila]|uniref:serine hydrolase domain-containing protein n=1 Tax=Aquimarina algiphila TaxID=2047982 RepID=UPI00232FB5D2|nr:serine hydrolase domain-containing protein [Aquimarina algiphila]
MYFLLKEIDTNSLSFKFLNWTSIPFDNTLKKIQQVILLLSILFMIPSCQSDDIVSKKDKELNLELEQLYKSSPLVGFSVSIVDDNDVLYQNSFGYADTKEDKKYTEYTTQAIASISKTVIALALMKAVEQEKLDLDTDINQYLPFEVKHPHYLEKPITIRHLATHTSGIKGVQEIDYRSYIFENLSEIDLSIYPPESKPFFDFVKANVDIDDATYLEKALAIDGEWYDVSNFSMNAPGEKYEYSNIASNLAAYVIEHATGISYEEYTHLYIFKPLEMNTTSWGKDNITADTHATLYLNKDLEIPNYTRITVASGELTTNNSDFNRYFIEMIKGYNGKGKLLSTEHYKEIFTPQATHEEIKDTTGGLFWIINNKGNIEHSGGGLGIVTSCLFNPTTNKGYYFMTNILEDAVLNPDVSTPINKILETLDIYMDKY